MAVYTVSGPTLLIKVDYADAAGGFGGWFLLNIAGDGVVADDDGNPANGPSSHGLLGQRLTFSTGNSLTGDLAGGTSGNQRYREALLNLVHARLERMFGVGHSATWTANVVQGVTPAVIDDNW